MPIMAKLENGPLSLSDCAQGSGIRITPCRIECSQPCAIDKQACTAYTERRGRRSVMVIRQLAIILVLFLNPAPALTEPSAATRLNMPDGQLKSHPIKVFINRDITRDMQPKLQLAASHAITEKQDGESFLREPMVLARHQEWTEIRHGTRVSVVGTLMLFDLSNYPIPFYKATMRLIPTLVWQENGLRQTAIGPSEVYMANSIGAFGWVLILIGSIVLFIMLMSRQLQGQAWYLLCDSDGSLSLWRTQVAAWTLAVGGVVAGYGLIRLEVPNIPESLLALMGMTLGTGGISHYQTRKQTPTDTSVPRLSPQLSDLICNILPDGKRQLSLARAQMLFWTLLILAMFVVKSVMDGDAWNVPWEMVALMGISQAGYLGPKLKI